jgi:lipopolysaccharide export LptBFGC system permease protein LptF
MTLKFLILAVCVVLMVVVAVLAVAGIQWALAAPKPPLIGGRVVLAVSVIGALACLWLLWKDRRERIR